MVHIDAERSKASRKNNEKNVFLPHPIRKSGECRCSSNRLGHAKTGFSCINFELERKHMCMVM